MESEPEIFLLKQAPYEREQVNLIITEFLIV